MDPDFWKTWISGFSHAKNTDIVNSESKEIYLFYTENWGNAYDKIPSEARRLQELIRLIKRTDSIWHAKTIKTAHDVERKPISQVGTTKDKTSLPLVLSNWNVFSINFGHPTIFSNQQVPTWCYVHELINMRQCLMQLHVFGTHVLGRNHVELLQRLNDTNRTPWNNDKYAFWQWSADKSTRVRNTTIHVEPTMPSNHCKDLPSKLSNNYGVNQTWAYELHQTMKCRQESKRGKHHGKCRTNDAK